MQTTQDVIARLHSPGFDPLEAPPYTGVDSYPKVMMAVEAMRRHTADAGWQLQIGLEAAGYLLCGKGFPQDVTDTREVLSRYGPNTLVIQDKREWEGLTARQYKEAHAMRFRDVGVLRDRRDIFKITVLKDAHQQPNYHKRSAEEMAVHGWITYYHPDIVKHVAPYVRMGHCVRTHHSLDPKAVPQFRTNQRYSTARRGVVLSGAISNHYPLRTAIYRVRQEIDKHVDLHLIRHPGYKACGCVTPQFLNELSQFKVAICTSSIYGYALRKIIEASACGCMVLTDLPSNEVLPAIDDNLYRIHPNTSWQSITEKLREMVAAFNLEKQMEVSHRAKSFYNWLSVGKRLALNIEHLRQSYDG